MEDVSRSLEKRLQAFPQPAQIVERLAEAPEPLGLQLEIALGPAAPNRSGCAGVVTRSPLSTSRLRVM